MRIDNRIHSLYSSRDEREISIWRALGYTFNRSWICIVFFNSVLFTFIDPHLRWSVINEVYLSSILCLAISLGLLGILFRQVISLFDLKFGEFLGPCIAGIGIALLYPSLSQGVEPPLLIIAASSLATGFGSALVLLDVGRAYAIVSRKMCVLEILIATVLAALLSLGVFFLPLLVVFGVTVVLPFLSVFCVRRSNGIKRQTKEHRGSQGEKLSRPMLAKFIICASVLGAVTGFMRDIYSFHSDDVFGIAYTLYFSIGALVASAFLILVIMFSKRFSIETLYKPVVLLCTIGFAIIPALGPSTQFPYLIVTMGYTVFEVLIWLILCEVANRFQYTSVQVFGIGRFIVLALGVIAGALVARIITDTDATDIQTLVIISAIAISLITFSRNYILTGHDLEEFEKSGEPSSEKTSRVPLLKRCQIIGEHYGLSKREVDVFHLLASGRNAARVQEELMISAGTVNTHTRHIYQKLDIHTHQELIDLMQSADLDEMTE